jgi:hypothetical protein
MSPQKSASAPKAVHYQPPATDELHDLARTIAGDQLGHDQMVITSLHGFVSVLVDIHDHHFNGQDR